MRFLANARNDRLLLGHMGSGGGSPGRASSTTPPEQNELSFRMDPTSAGEMRNLTSHIKIKELMRIIPDTH